MSTADRRCCGHSVTGPMLVELQSNEPINRAISPPWRANSRLDTKFPIRRQHHSTRLDNRYSTIDKANPEHCQMFVRKAIAHRANNGMRRGSGGSKRRRPSPGSPRRNRRHGGSLCAGTFTDVRGHPHDNLVRTMSLPASSAICPWRTAANRDLPLHGLPEGKRVCLHLLCHLAAGTLPLFRRDSRAAGPLFLPAMRIANVLCR